MDRALFLIRHNYRYSNGLTLLELIIAICIFTLIVVGFSNIDIFSRYHVLNADKRAKLQNEVSHVLGHMTRYIGRAVGDVNQPAVTLTTIGGDNAVKVWIDYNENGKRDTSVDDKEIAYAYSASNYQIRYYSNYTDNPSSYELLTSGRVRPDFSSTTSQYTYFQYVSSADNDCYVQVTACWDPDESPVACGSMNNPSVAMRTSIHMPGVSTN